jgi:hypothetical protein
MTIRTAFTWIAFAILTANAFCKMTDFTTGTRIIIAYFTTPTIG